MEHVVHSAVLVLNQNYEPLNVCNARRAVVLVDKGKAEIIEHKDDRIIHTASPVVLSPLRHPPGLPHPPSPSSTQADPQRALPA